MSKKNKLTFKTEVVNGKCPTCDQFTMLVNIDVVFFRCMSCGGAAQIPCDKCLQQGKVREYEEILIEWLVILLYILYVKI